MSRQAKRRRKQAAERRRFWKAWLAVALAFCTIAVARLLWLRAWHDSPPAQTATKARGPLRVDEKEPNDSALQAQTIASLPVEIVGRLTPRDRDLYRWTVAEPGGHLLDVRIEGLAGARLAVRRRDGTTLAEALAPARIGALGVVASELLFSVEGATGEYRLLADQAPWVKGLDWEPDDDADHAQPMEQLPAGDRELAHARAQGRWSRPDDIDCYTFALTVPAAGAMARIDLKPPEGVRAELWVLDAGNPEAKIPRKELTRAAARTAGEHAVVPALGERSWEPSYVVCTRATEGERFDERYVLEARSFTPDGPFEFEPNDTRDTASALPRDVPLHGYLTDGDVDWFRVSAGANGEVHASVSGVPGVTTGIVLRDESGRELARATGEPGQTVAASHALAVFVEVRAVAGGNAAHQYQIFVKGK